MIKNLFIFGFITIFYKVASHDSKSLNNSIVDINETTSKPQIPINVIGNLSNETGASGISKGVPGEADLMNSTNQTAITVIDISGANQTTERKGFGSKSQGLSEYTICADKNCVECNVIVICIRCPDKYILAEGSCFLQAKETLPSGGIV